MILVFGSINIDLAFAVDTTPVPGETVLCPSYLMNPGGKGANQAVAAARAGGTVAMAGCVGRDAFAAPALTVMREAKVELSTVLETDTPTGCAAIWVDSRGENSIVVASGANRQVRAAQVPDSLLTPDTLVLMQMEVPHEENWALIERARAHGAKTALNVAPAAPVPAAALDALDLLIVNEVEGAAIARADGLDAVSAEALPQRLAERHDLTCVLTLGAKGAILHGRSGGSEIPALPVTPRDTTGAGDTFAGVLAAGLDHGLDMVAAARRASAAAALSCLEPGAQAAIPTAEEIDAAVGRLPEARPKT